MGRRGKKAQVCSYSQPQWAMRTKQTPSQTTEDSIADAMEGQRSFSGWWRARALDWDKHSGSICAEVSQGLRRVRHRRTKLRRRSLENSADFRTVVSGFCEDFMSSLCCKKRKNLVHDRTRPTNESDQHQASSLPRHARADAPIRCSASPETRKPRCCRSAAQSPKVPNLAQSRLAQILPLPDQRLLIVPSNRDIELLKK